MKNDILNKKGFTLAEVLITLAIIGVVAALTIPTLVKNYQKHQMLVQLKKVYSTLNQILTKSVVDNGPISTWDLSTENYENFSKTYILPYAKVLKDCETGDGCISRRYATKRFPDQELTSTLAGTTLMTSFIMSDGTGIGLGHGRAGQVVINVDLDGPNKGIGKFKSFGGKDRFTFMIGTFTKGVKLDLIALGVGTTSDRSTNLVGCSQYGISCTTLLIYYDKWQIADDYPW